jgi:hypothetical protein
MSVTSLARMFLRAAVASSSQPLVNGGDTEVVNTGRIDGLDLPVYNQPQHFHSRLVIQTIGWVIG